LRDRSRLVAGSTSAARPEPGAGAPAASILLVATTLYEHTSRGAQRAYIMEWLRDGGMTAAPSPPAASTKAGPIEATTRIWPHASR